MGKRINISVTLVSESYVILYCEKNVICNSSIKICLNQSKGATEITALEYNIYVKEDYTMMKLVTITSIKSCQFKSRTWWGVFHAKLICDKVCQ